MLYTRKGDKGTSTLFDTSERFAKDDPIYEALGTLDELNSLLGVCRARSAHLDSAFDVTSALLSVQECLFIVQAELAGAKRSLRHNSILGLEETIDHIDQILGPIHGFIIPGGTELSAFLDLARAVSRRAERAVIRARAVRPVHAATTAYLNRVSSLLFALARYTAREVGAHELSPSYR